MKFERTGGDVWDKAVHETGGTLLRVPETTEMEEKHVDELHSLLRTKEEGYSARADDLFKIGKVQDDTLLHAEIDLQMLWTLLYEHRRYAAAKGFSDAEMDVLRAIEFHHADRVSLDEIRADHHTEDVSESMMFKSLKRLQEKDLIKKIKGGLYEYSGP